MFNFNDAEENKKLLPNGFYPVSVAELEWKYSKAGTEYLSMVLNVLGTKRKLFHTFNFFHEKEQVRQIALGDMKGLMVAGGIDVSQLTNADKDQLTDLIYGLNVIAKVGVQKNEEYGDKNVVKGWKAPEKQTFANDELGF